MPKGEKAKKQQQLLSGADVTIINIEALRTYQMPKVQCFVVDEAHHLRGRESQQGRGARKVAFRTPYVCFLTATPFYRADEDVWHLLHLLEPKKFSSYWNFIREWFSVDWEAEYAPKIYGVSRSKRVAFNHLLAPYMLLRDYKDVGKELPPLIENILTVELPLLEAVRYRTLKEEWQLDGAPIESVGKVYYELRQITMCHRKIDTVRDLVEDIPHGESALVYVWYRESARLLAERLRAGKQACMVITGDTPPAQRAAMLANQKATGMPRVIVATIEALQEGVNLEHIHTVIYAEETYVQGKHIQTLARAHRDQQTDTPTPVNVYYVRARKTIDERIPVIRNSRGHAGNRELARELAAN
jgi:superfamily II DNA or RNA helicase